MALTVVQVRQLYLGGTVHFPSVFPELAEILIDVNGVTFEKHTANGLATLTIKEDPSDNVVRTLLLKDVAAVFIPNDESQVDFSNGEWLVGLEIQDATIAPTNLSVAKQANASGKGIVFVPEHICVLNELKNSAYEQELELGATAAESEGLRPRTCCIG